MKRRRHHSVAEDGTPKVRVTKMNKATCALHSKKRLFLDRLLGGPEPERCGTLTPAMFIEQHQEVSDFCHTPQLHLPRSTLLPSDFFIVVAF
jgi:hypothetical protein